MTAPAAATTTTTGGRYCCPRSPWLLPEDGIIDDLAVELAATGARRVALTPGERLAVAARILAAGGTPYVIGQRLHINSAHAHALATATTTHQPGTAA